MATCRICNRDDADDSISEEERRRFVDMGLLDVDGFFHKYCSHVFIRARRLEGLRR